MSLINFGSGLSNMGQSIAQSAGDAGILSMKADLEKQRDVLASQLQEGRESRLETQRAASASQLSKQQSGERVGEYQSEKDIDIQNLPAVAKANQQILEDQMSDPKYVKALRTRTDATATPEQRAAAGLYAVQAMGAKIANQANQDLLDAKTALKKATASGDTDAVQAAEKQVAAAEYSMHDEVQRAAALAQMATNDRMEVQSLESELAAKSVAPIEEQPEQAAQRKGLIAQIQGNLDVARSNYQNTRSMAAKAASSIPTFDANGSQQGGRPPLSSFLGGQSKAPPAPAKPVPTGVINASAP